MVHGVSCSAVWDLPGPGLEPVSPALAGGFLTTAPPGKPQDLTFYSILFPTSHSTFLLKKKKKNIYIYIYIYIYTHTHTSLNLLQIFE